MYECHVIGVGGTYLQDWIIDDSSGFALVRPETNIIPAFRATYSEGKLSIISGMYDGVMVSGGGWYSDNAIGLSVKSGAILWKVDGIRK